MSSRRPRLQASVRRGVHGARAAPNISCEKDLIRARYEPLVKEDLPAILAVRKHDVAGSPLERRRRKGLSTGLPSLVLEEPTARGPLISHPRAQDLGPSDGT